MARSGDSGSNHGANHGGFSHEDCQRELMLTDKPPTGPHNLDEWAAHEADRDSRQRTQDGLQGRARAGHGRALVGRLVPAEDEGGRQ